MLAWGHVAAPAVASGLALTRIGCYPYGCDFGAPLPDAPAPALPRRGAFTALYGSWRFFIEMLRDDPQRGFSFGFSASQLASLVLVALAIGAWGLARRRGAHVGPAAWTPGC